MIQIFWLVLGFLVEVGAIDPLRVHSRLISYAVDQRENDLFFSDCTIDPETMSEQILDQTVTLDEVIHVGKFSAIFSIKESDLHLIKYQVDCSDDNSHVHSLLRDAWMSDIANQMGIGAVVRFISPPIELPEEPTGKLIFAMKPSEWNSCRARKGTVRFVLIDKVEGMSLDRFKALHAPHGMALVEAIPIVRILLYKLEILHSAGVIHGDIRLENLMVYDNTDDDVTVEIIDFKDAFFDNEFIENDGIFYDAYYSQEMATPWRIRGLPRGKRDDVYRCLDILARLINPKGWEYHVRDLVREGTTAVLNWRTTGFLFEVPSDSVYSGRNPLTACKLQVSDTSVVGIKSRLEKILDLVLELEDVNMIPPYHEIQSQLREISEILEGRRILDQLDNELIRLCDLYS